MTPSADVLLPDVKRHLNIPESSHNSEIVDFIKAAQQWLEIQPLKAQFATLDLTANPLLRMVVLEMVRDMWGPTQQGAGAYPTYGQGEQQIPVRSVMSQFTLSLLADMVGSKVEETPVGSFPEPLGWPDRTAYTAFPTY